MANNSGSILKKFLSDILFDRFKMFISINGNTQGSRIKVLCQFYQISLRHPLDLDLALVASTSNFTSSFGCHINATR